MYISNIILIISLSIILILNIISIKRKNKVIKKLELTKTEDLKNVFKERWDKEENEFNLKKAQLDTAINGYKALLIEKEKRYNEVNQDLDLYRNGKIEEINKAAAEYEEHKQNAIDYSIDEYRDLQIKRANEVIYDLVEAIKIERNALEEERSKRAAINKEIKRAREIQEQEDFYKIQLNPDDVEDIKLLRSITSRLRHPEAINKVIWTGYYQKPLAELRKRAAIEDSGVYKITRLKTGEVYIGQATNVSTRWAEHCKAALGVGTLASSQLHRTMAEDGCENFTFELIEAVEKNKLRERESYYIDFYNSKNYGLNTLSGDKNK